MCEGGGEREMAPVEMVMSWKRRRLKITLRWWVEKFYCQSHEYGEIQLKLLFLVRLLKDEITKYIDLVS